METIFEKRSRKSTYQICFFLYKLLMCHPLRGPLFENTINIDPDTNPTTPPNTPTIPATFPPPPIDRFKAARINKVQALV